MPDLAEPDYFDDLPWPEEDGVALSESDMADIGWTDGGGDEDEDGDEDGNALYGGGNAQAGKKILAVSSERARSAPLVAGASHAQTDIDQRWRQLVMRLREPLATIMSRARVDSIDAGCVEVTLSEDYRDIFGARAKYVQDVERVLDMEIGSGCRLKVKFSDIRDAEDTIAAARAREEIRMQEAAFAQVLGQPVMQKVMEVFHVDPEGIRFTFNPDRTSK
ncbi:MAG: hypothetical protein IKY83_13520 [Proteobacteria bacterium]|nr:hypothetical protein [Pseudomonadota bacterium]